MSFGDWRIIFHCTLGWLTGAFSPPANFPRASIRSVKSLSSHNLGCRPLNFRPLMVLAGPLLPAVFHL